MPQSNRARTYHDHNYRDHESGNAFVFILLAVVLFASLAFTVSRGMQSQTTNALSAKELDLAVTDILTYAQRVERAVDRVRRKGCSEDDISFVNPIESGYAHGTPPDNKCKVFHTSGGKITWKNPPDGVNNGDAFVINGANVVDGIGTGASDLVLFLPNITENVCNTINSRLNIATAALPPADGSSASITAKFTGSFPGLAAAIGPAGGGTADFTGLTTVCFEGGGTPAAGTYHFYHVLLIRR